MRHILTVRQGLFRRIGPITRLELRYDRAGRSEGTAYVTYEAQQDATDAIREFDGANAAGKTSKLTQDPVRSSNVINCRPADSPDAHAVGPGTSTSQPL
jgi:RNA recognition motif-containing protein